MSGSVGIFPCCRRQTSPQTEKIVGIGSGGEGTAVEKNKNDFDLKGVDERSGSGCIAGSTLVANGNTNNSAASSSSSAAAAGENSVVTHSNGAPSPQVVDPDHVQLLEARKAFFEAGSPTSGQDDLEKRFARRTCHSSEGSDLVRELELNPEMAAELTSLVSRLEAVTNRLEGVAGKGAAPEGGAGGTPVPEELAAFVVAYDEIVSGPFREFLSHSNSIGGDVKTQCDMVQAAFTAQRDFLIKVSRCKQPSQDVLIQLLQPTSEKIAAIQEFREKNRGSAHFNHLSAISESIPLLGWVGVSPTPGPFVRDMAEAGQFFSNRVIKDFKEQDKMHVEWARAWSKTATALQAYIKRYHTTGISWNAQGGDAGAAAVGHPKAAAGPPPPPGGGPPPPPPPGPPPPPVAGTDAAPSDSSSSRAALFADLNKGGDVTKGLKKVTDDMKVQKNPSLKYASPQPYKPMPGPKPFKAFTPSTTAAKAQGTTAAAAAPAAKPAKTFLEGKKWIVEHHNNNRSIVLDDTQLKQTVYVYKCQNSTIQIKGKINSITVDGCKKTAIVFEDVISGIDFVNCQSVQAQVTGKVHTVSIDKTDGCMVYLSKDSLEAEIVSAKSSEMNILIPDASGEYKEFAVPEQFKTRYNGKKLVTEPTDIGG